MKTQINKPKTEVKSVNLTSENNSNEMYQANDQNNDNLKIDKMEYEAINKAKTEVKSVNLLSKNSEEDQKEDFMIDLEAVKKIKLVPLDGLSKQVERRMTEIKNKAEFLSKTSKLRQQTYHNPNTIRK